MEKQSIRRLVLSEREKLDDGERRKAEILITERILGHQWFYNSDILLCFANYGTEISTKEIWLEALRLGKRVYMPKIVSDNDCTQMKFYRIKSREDLMPGYRGIPEPIKTDEEFQYTLEETNRVLMLMPGVAFDVYRNRIGYGKGFYDRYLHDKPNLQLRTIGIGFSCQLLQEIPFSDSDIRPYQVICM